MYQLIFTNRNHGTLSNIPAPFTYEVLNRWCTHCISCLSSLLVWAVPDGFCLPCRCLQVLLNMLSILYPEQPICEQCREMKRADRVQQRCWDETRTSKSPGRWPVYKRSQCCELSRVIHQPKRWNFPRNWKYGLYYKISTKRKCNPSWR